MNETGCELLILVPIYKRELNLLEQFSVDYLRTKVSNRKICFVAPEGLDKSYYLKRYGEFNYCLFEDKYFISIDGYNQLLLSVDFYERFEDYSHILIHQTDALLFKDDLDMWMASGYSYLGAPWPNGMSLNFKSDENSEGSFKTLTSYVGNGGFSMRSIKASLMLIKDNPSLHMYWKMNKYNEDCFFSFGRYFSEKYFVPESEQAAFFSMEMDPSGYFNKTHKTVPTGCHAWWKYDLPFWQNIISMVG